MIEQEYQTMFNQFVEFYKVITDKPVYKTLPDLTGLNVNQIDNIVSTKCMMLVMSAKKKDQERLFNRYSNLISMIRQAHLSELSVLNREDDLDE